MIVGGGEGGGGSGDVVVTLAVGAVVGWDEEARAAPSKAPVAMLLPP